MVKKKQYKKSPLAPKSINKLLPIKGITLFTYCANFYNKKRNDLSIFLFHNKSYIAEVFTKSSLRSATLDWNEKALKGKEVQAIIVNAGNANTFTGNNGKEAIKLITEKVASKFNISYKKIFVASTGVIGEPFPTRKVLDVIDKKKSSTKNWLEAAKAMMTTDTFPKGISIRSSIGNEKVTITGIAKGSGMIEPNMATMLGFIFTDASLDQKILQLLMNKFVIQSFNSISVDGDESTNDTVVLAATNVVKFKNKISSINDKRLSKFKKDLKKIFSYLSEQIARDGEGATKLIEVKVMNAQSSNSAEKIARSIANSSLVKTAVYGNDPNWGRIVMAIGKTYEKINVKKLKISFGDYLVAVNGEINSKINEKKLINYLSRDKIIINVDLGLGKKQSNILTCDLSHQYIDINASYKS
jgi:glutamate N-acetyltransferase/amino-acid N-acetyltransferase